MEQGMKSSQLGHQASAENVQKVDLAFYFLGSYIS